MTPIIEGICSKYLHWFNNGDNHPCQCQTHRSTEHLKAHNRSFVGAAACSEATSHNTQQPAF